MSKIVYLFPGQGAQYPGMGRELYDAYPCARNIFDNIDTLLKTNLLDIIFNGPEEELKKTENTQPAILAVSIALMKILQEKGIKPDAAAGLSLGEYGALVTSGVIKFEDALPLVKKRGKLMQETVPQGKGTMAAIIGLDRDTLNGVIDDASKLGIVEAVNYNCPGQVSIAGEVPAVEKAVEIAKERGASRSLILQVSAPFHSSMLRPAGDALKEELTKLKYDKGCIPVVSNVDADYYSFDEGDVVDRLSRQVYSPVLFEDSIIRLVKDGYDTFIEIGPGKALSGFVKRISKDVRIFNVEDAKSLEKTLAGF